MSGNGSEIEPRLEPWDRQKGESRAAYASFVVFRDLGPSRTLARAAQETGKTRATLMGHSAKYGWVERAELWDARQYEDDREIVRRLRDEAVERQAAIGGGLVSLAMLRLAGDEAEGIEALHGNELGPAEIARFVEVGVRVERMALGMSTENVRGALMIAPADFTRYVSALVGIAERYVPEDRWAAFLEEVAGVSTS